ncbi:flavohemoglobin expression-modulating QEGLA motif protein [Mesorhizobium sp. SB112]|uniref:flavohemoglobin expression-modulating QEGLA motif protein n=1 Tax=Mesorhizobium sp. SB112 TaxID=3151853 RepID=UPI00326376D7
MKPDLVSSAQPMITDIKQEIAALISEGKPIRRDLPDGGRLHIDRPLPFLCVHIGLEPTAARDVVSSNASYLFTSDATLAKEICCLISRMLTEHCHAFLLLDFGELEKDRFLTDDAPVLTAFEIAVTTGSSAPEHAAMEAFTAAAVDRKSKYRTPRIEKLPNHSVHATTPLSGLAGVSTLTVRFAPIYRVPGHDGIYPDLKDRVVANMMDSGLRAVAAYVEASGLKAPASHRSLGRRAFIDAVTRADRAMDKVARAFDLLLAVTPINSEAAWGEFEAGRYSETPTFLYRPLEFEVSAQKRKLFAISLDQLEDPLLTELYLEKQQELDLQLSMIALREAPKFVEIGRAVYGAVEPELLHVATAILEDEAMRDRANKRKTLLIDCNTVATAAREMISDYRRMYPRFDASIEIRSDLPTGLLVSANRLLVSRATTMPAERLAALLSHEIGVHLLTYYNGSAQGLHILSSGLAGHEGMQEGLAVFAEYLTGGMTPERLQLLAARVVACNAMLKGAIFPDTFRLLTADYGLDEQRAFNVVLRVYRGGGLAKDAIYLRGLLEVLSHLKNGGSLTPFWMGKISAGHFAAVEELRTRGLLKPPAIQPTFLASNTVRQRLKKAMAGLTPMDMIET